MALHGPIEVNGQRIGYWSAVRQLTTDARPRPDDVLTYRCGVQQDETLEGNPAVNWQGEVRHRFGDGALALQHKVIGAALAATSGLPAPTVPVDDVRASGGSFKRAQR